jgi:hypothetical protein
MKTTLVSFGICALLSVIIPSAETQAAEVTAACQQENGLFAFDHPTFGKLTDLSQFGLDQMIADSGGPKTSAEPVAKCPEEKVSMVSAVKNWFTQFREQATGEEQATKEEKVTHTGKDGDFEAVLFMTQDAETILENNNAPNWHQETVSITIGDAIEALLLFRGCLVDSNGTCLVTADYVIESPDGSIYQQALNTDVWKETASPLLTYTLTKTRIGFVLQSDAKAGLYKVRVTVSDQISGKRVSVAGNVMAHPRTDDGNEKAQRGVMDDQTNPWLEAPLQDISVYTK